MVLDGFPDRKRTDCQVRGWHVRKEGPTRNLHTLDQLGDGTLIACGGYGAEKMCHHFVPSLPYGTWTMSATMRYARKYLTSAVLGGKMLLLGGIVYNGNGTVVWLDSTEEVGGDLSFNLQQKTW